MIVEAIKKLALIVFTRLRSIKNREESDLQSIAHCNAGVASHRMGLTDEAEKQYELVDGLV